MLVVVEFSPGFERGVPMAKNPDTVEALRQLRCAFEQAGEDFSFVEILDKTITGLLENRYAEINLVNALLRRSLKREPNLHERFSEQNIRLLRAPDTFASPQDVIVIIDNAIARLELKRARRRHRQEVAAMSE